MTRMTEIDGTEKIYDSRDIIARIEELEGERADLVEAVEEARAVYTEGQEVTAHDTLAADDLEAAQEALDDWDKGDEGAELKELKSLADDFGGYGDWEHGDVIIREDHFQDYAEELAEDIGTVSREREWPFCHIDWEAAAEALKMDYTTAKAFGHTWYMRA